MADTMHTSNPKDAAQDAKNKAQGAASSALEAAKGAASTAADKARQFASTAGQKAEDAMSYAGSGVRSLGDTIKSGGQYLQGTDLQSMGEDLVNLIRRNPIPSLCVGFALGFLLSRVFRS